MAQIKKSRPFSWPDRARSPNLVKLIILLGNYFMHFFNWFLHLIQNVKLHFGKANLACNFTFRKLHFRLGVLEAYKSAGSKIEDVGSNCHFATYKYGVKNLNN